MPQDRSERRQRPRGAGSRARAPRVEQVEARQLLATFTVLGVGDAGPGTLRQAILDANATPGPDAINFGIPGPGPFSIAPTSDLPVISDPAIIDATTQPGFAGSPVVELNGSLDVGAGNSGNGLRITAPNTTVRGLTINRFDAFGIVVSGASGGTIAGNAIGTDPSGTLAQANLAGGIFATGATGITIGGRNLADRNLVAGNRGDGIVLASPSGLPTGNSVLGNLIGTDATGSRALPNVGNGVFVSSSGNQVGGAGPGEANTIAFNGLAGVRVGTFNFETGRTSNPIRGNAIVGNNALGIDLGNAGVTFNGSAGTGIGPNRLQAFPVVNSAYPSGGGTTVEGQLTSTPNSSFAVDFYANDAADPSGFGEGQRYLGTAQVTTGADGVATFSAGLAAGVPAGQFLTATATDRDNNTSEFSLAASVTATPLADLALSFGDSPDPVQVGQDLTYTVVVSNDGPSRATNVTLTDALPAGATFVSATPSQGTLAVAGGVLTANLGILATGEVATLRIVVRPTAEGTLTDTVSVRADQADPDARDNTATVNTTVSPATPADLSVFAFASDFQVAVGQDLTYTVVVNNNGPSNLAAGVSLVDTLPEGATLVSAIASQGTVATAGGTVTADLGSLSRGANATVRITVRATTPGRLINTATVRGAQVDPNSLNNTSTLETPVNAPFADLSTSVVALPDPVRVGRALTYTITVGNFGPDNATGATLTDELDPGVTLVSASASQGTIATADGIVTANLGTLVVGQFAQVTIVVLPSAVGTITNRATSRADQPDFNPGNNAVTTETQVSDESIPPTILSQRLIVTRTAITGVVLTFSEAMDPVQAESLNNYGIRASGGGGAPTAALASARYNASRRSVTFSFSRPLALGRFYQITANGEGASGLVDLAGNVLDGDRNGLPDGIYQSSIGRGTKTRPRPFQRDQLVPIPAPVVRPKAQAPAHRQSPTTPVNSDVSVNLSFAKRVIRTVG